MAFRNTRVTVGLIDQTVNSVDYVTQDSAGAFQIYMDTCQKTGVTVNQIIAQRLANGDLATGWLDYAPTIVSTTFDEVEQKLTKVLDFDSEGQYTMWRSSVEGILLDSAGTTGLFELASNTTATV